MEAKKTLKTRIKEKHGKTSQITHQKNLKKGKKWETRIYQKEIFKKGINTEQKEKRKSKLADKPGSVVDSHSSNPYITARL